MLLFGLVLPLNQLAEDLWITSCFENNTRPHFEASGSRRAAASVVLKSARQPDLQVS